MKQKRWDDVHPYTRGWDFWSKNRFWKTGMYSEKEQSRLDKWVEKMKSDRQVNLGK